MLYSLYSINKLCLHLTCLEFQYYMKKFTTLIVEMMKKEKFFASQGGPIILSQASGLLLLFYTCQTMTFTDHVGAILPATKIMDTLMLMLLLIFVVNPFLL